MFAALKSLFSRGDPESDGPQVPAKTATRAGAIDSQIDSTPRIRDQYPNVVHLAINLTIRAPFQEMEPTLNNRSLGPESAAYFRFRCKNVDCQEGGFDLTESLEAAIGTGQTDAAGRQVCQGWRSAQLTNQQRCHFELNFQAHIDYL